MTDGIIERMVHKEKLQIKLNRHGITIIRTEHRMQEKTQGTRRILVDVINPKVVHTMAWYSTDIEIAVLSSAFTFTV